MELLRIWSGGLDIRSAPTSGEPYGLYLGPRGFTGWDDQPVTRRTAAERPNAHGEFDVPGFLAGRLISIANGICIARSTTDLEKWRALVTGHGADGSPFPVNVEKGGHLHTATARLAGGQQTTFVDNGSGLRASFSMAWWAADPRRYEKPDPSEVNAPGPSISILNRGNFPASPRLVVRGSQPGGYTITGPGGRQIIVQRPLNTGEAHTIDLSTGRLYVNGQRVIRGFARLQMFTVPASSAIQVSVSGGTIEADSPHVFV
ncbi:hypothetical protein B0I12_002218 [Microbacterium hydrothermale]|uniref:hypothetical protein n=1 Tax=Microbacterium hydrothermale TaxID=857427 RepID=UPI002227C7A3|nr:hypothetical protein [Microbacterium hydrothermale]MCW2165063.1 hypothetical protein [Microbacterium hydrothermale]